MATPTHEVGSVVLNSNPPGPVRAADVLAGPLAACDPVARQRIEELHRKVDYILRILDAAATRLGWRIPDA